jgi:peptidoglycan/xylan/chitin deacetylase (PgdA/CDA1 family)
MTSLRPLRFAAVLALGLALLSPALPLVVGGGGVTAVTASSRAPFATHGSRTIKAVALTIDDCDNEAAVTALLGILQAQHVNATFFCIGKVVAADPRFWARWAKAGYPMANHTYYHTNLNLKSYATVVAELKKDNAVVARIIGRPLLPVMRPMGGNYDSTVLAAAAAAGEKLVLNWDVSVCDTSAVYGGGKVPSATTRYLNDLIKNGERGGNGAVILMHAKGPYTQQALPSIIAYYKAHGFIFETVGQMFGLGGLVPFPRG